MSFSTIGSNEISTLTSVGSVKSYKRAASFPPLMKLSARDTCRPRKTLFPFGCAKIAKL
jgi:hypothetical protein